MPLFAEAEVRVIVAGNLCAKRIQRFEENRGNRVGYEKSLDCFDRNLKGTPGCLLFNETTWTVSACDLRELGDLDALTIWHLQWCLCYSHR